MGAGTSLDKWLNRTGVDSAQLILGTMTFGDQIEEPEAVRAINRAYELGVSIIDTANSYVGGQSEIIVGRAVDSFRDEIKIASKVGSRRSMSDPNAQRLDRVAVIQACDESLARLGIDHIDLYYLHMPDDGTPIEETLSACQELKDAGKIGDLGMSNYAAWQLADAARLAEASGWARVAASQPMYNLLARRTEEEHDACVERFDIANFVFNPLAGGLLTGKHQFDTAPAPGTRFSDRANYVERYWNDHQFAAVERLKLVAADAGLTLLELALRWLVGRPSVDGVILGVSSIEHLESNVAAAHGPALDSDTLDAVDEVWRDLRGPAPSYNR